MKPEIKITLDLSESQAASLQHIASAASRKLGSKIDPEIVALVLLDRAMSESLQLWNSEKQFSLAKVT